MLPQSNNLQQTYFTYCTGIRRVLQHVRCVQLWLPVNPSEENYLCIICHLLLFWFLIISGKSQTNSARKIPVTYIHTQWASLCSQWGGYKHFPLHNRCCWWMDSFPVPRLLLFSTHDYFRKDSFSCAQLLEGKLRAPSESSKSTTTPWKGILYIFLSIYYSHQYLQTSHIS